MLTDIRDKKKEDEKKSEDSSKNNERSTSSLSAGLRKIWNSFYAVVCQSINTSDTFHSQEAVMFDKL